MAGSTGAVKTAVASAARTATGNSGAIVLPPRMASGTLVLDVTAQSGTTPTLNVYLQGSYDGGTSWIDIAAFTQVGAATGKKALAFGPDRASSAATDFVVGDAVLAAGTVRPFDLPTLVRVKWVVAGVTPSYTFAVYLASGDVDL